MTAAHPVRAWSADDIPAVARVEIASWRAAYGGIIEAAVLDRLDFARITIRWQRAFDRGVSVTVAEAGGELVGFASRAEDEITMLYVDPARWRRGLGRVLLRRMLAEIAVSGTPGAWLWVLTQNLPARRFYAAEGGVAAEPGKTRVGALELDQIRYRWDFSRADAGWAAPFSGR